MSINTITPHTFSVIQNNQNVINMENHGMGYHFLNSVSGRHHKFRCILTQEKSRQAIQKQQGIYLKHNSHSHNTSIKHEYLKTFKQVFRNFIHPQTRTNN